jgi:hypothetical protein
MAATTAKATLTGFYRANEQTETADAVRLAQNSFLSELPGATFALLTLAYVVMSLVALQ